LGLFMKTASILAFFLTVAAAGSSLASVDIEPREPLAPLSTHANTTRNIVDALAGRHYVSTTLNDDLSSQIFDAYLESLDSSKSYLLQSDVDTFSSYRYEMDDALRKGDLKPAFEMWNRYHQRYISRLEKIVASLEQGIDTFDFNTEEELQLDREEAPWARSDDELNEWWHKRIKHEVLNLKLTGKEVDKIQKLLTKRYSNRLSLTKQTRSEDVYQVYMNSFTATYDPHTQYYSPRNTENFNINMSLSLEGIGAVLQQEDEYTKVVSLVPAGPADKSKLIKPNDKIIGVGQGEDGEVVDVIGWRLTDVVQLIRGKKDTRVKLDIIPAGSEASQSKVIHITRNTVKLEEQSAKSSVIELEQYGETHKIGVIDIPTFYSDFKALQAGDQNYKSTTRDVRKLLLELDEQEVEGVIIDLRNNGGGSLTEARSMTGLFIDRGPIVQLKYKSNRVDMLHDRDPSIVYDGPLAVLVNRLSASASEIFAGAIQDYERGIIIGSQTFGKGTVQTIVPLPLNRGQLKLTQAKFYRISGDSNQHKGIIPDISYPGNWDPETIGESALDAPLPFDTIRPTTYRTKSPISHLVPDLRNKHLARVETDPEFTYVKEAIAYRREQSNDKTISLNEQIRIQEKEASEAFFLALENTKRAAQGLEALASLDELEEEPVVAQVTPTGVPIVQDDAASADSPNNDDGADSAGADTETRTGGELAGVGEVARDQMEPEAEKQEDTDAFLNETGNILLDLISIQKVTAMVKTAGSHI
jgi:carboxyl-terminal processing protease